MSKFATIADKISAKSDELQAAKEKFRAEMQETFKDINREFFEEFPMVQAITWNQFTPHFNDGDPCVFSMGDIHFVTDGFDADELMDPYAYEDLSVYTGNLDEAIARYVGYAERAGNDDYRKEYEDRIAILTKQKEQYPNLGEAAGVFEKILYQNEDVLEHMFGDGVSVYLTKDRIITEDYDHD